jgi:indolepyruvate ferredoxin oxidoreductase alpha subunit
MRFILSGNEAIARGFLYSGGKVAAAYPGTPSTEVLVELSRHKGIHAEWSTNEKVAFEVAMGASLAGVRAMACMKHVASTLPRTRLLHVVIQGERRLILMAADDPGMFSFPERAGYQALCTARKDTPASSHRTRRRRWTS